MTVCANCGKESGMYGHFDRELKRFTCIPPAPEPIPLAKQIADLLNCFVQLTGGGRPRAMELIDQISAGLAALQTKYAECQKQNGENFLRATRAQNFADEVRRELAALQEENWRLRNGLPKSVDGVPLINGQAVYRRTITTGEVEPHIIKLIPRAMCEHYNINADIDDCFSTRELAEAAATAGEEPRK